jgi:hypothetical protein
MKAESRKAAIAAYKERKSLAGIYALRHAASGRIWVGQTPDLEKVENRIWFSLRLGGHTCRNLQAAWAENAGEGFIFERLEALDHEESRYIRDALLKERMAHWRSSLDAAAT